MKIKPSVVAVLGATAVAILGLIAWLIATDRDPTLLISSIPIIIPLVANLLKTAKVETQTNGMNHELRAKAVAADTEIKQLRTVLTPEQAMDIPIVPVVPAPVTTLANEYEGRHEA